MQTEEQINAPIKCARVRFIHHILASVKSFRRMGFAKRHKQFTHLNLIGHFRDIISATIRCPSDILYF